MDALTAAYQRELNRTRNQVADAVGKAWDRLGSYNESDVPRFVAQVVPYVQAGQVRAAHLSSAYAAKRLGIPPVGLDVAAVTGAAVRNGATPAEVYRRPFVRVWTDLQDTGDYDYAVQTGGDQARSNSLMDVALSTMAAYLAFTSAVNGSESGDGEIVAWRRVADSGCCEFCSEIDGAHTGPTQPQPLHNRCGCTAEPITRSASSSMSDRGFLTPGSDHGITAIHEHGELGPVIGKVGDSFTSADDLHLPPQPDESIDDFLARRRAERAAA